MFNTIAARILKRIHTFPTYRWVTLSAWCGQGTTAVVQIAAIRLLLSTFGTDKFAAFALLSGLQGFLNLSDFGLGATLQNNIAEAEARGEESYGLTLIAIIIGAIFLLALLWLLTAIAPFIAHDYLAKVTTLSYPVKHRITIIAVGSLMVVGSGQIPYKAWYGQHRGYLSNFATASGYALGLIATWVYLRISPAPRITTCLAMYFGPRALVAAVSYLSLLQPALAHLPAILRNGRRRVAQQWRSMIRLTLSRCTRFWFLASQAVIILQVDYLILSQHSTSQAITVYNISTKLFNFAFLLYSAILTALWPHLTRLLTQNNAKEAAGLVHNLLKKAILVAAGGLTILIAIFPRLAHFLSPHHQIVAPLLFLVGNGFYILVQIWVNTYATVLQSVSDISIFLWIGPFQLVLNVALQLYLVKSYGITGIMAGLILSYLLTSCWLLPVRAYQVLRRIGQIPDPAIAAG